MCRGEVRDRRSAWQAQEKHEMDELAWKHNLFHMMLHDASASQTTTAFLEQLETCASTLSAEAASRQYRDTFSVNYRMLFDYGHDRSYRPELLDASRAGCPEVHVNGEHLPFSDKAVAHAAKLNHCFDGLASILRSWNLASQRQGDVRPVKKEVQAVFEALDRAWASFEHAYLRDLIEIEGKARMPLVEAAKHERILKGLEEKHGTAPLHLREYVDEQRLLFARLAHINSVANITGKGRADLNPQPVIAALQIISRCEASKPNSNEFVRPLAEDLVRAYEEMRQYLRRVANCPGMMPKVDPHLSNNPGLVDRLAALEEAWEVGSRYILDTAMQDSMHHTIAAMKMAQRIVPEFGSMCSDYDAELFLVLPRLVWLGYLNAQAHDALLKDLLPHLFRRTEESLLETSSDLNDFIHEFSSTQHILEGALWAANGDSAPAVARRLLLRRIITGADLDSEGVHPPLHEICKRAVEIFVRKLERWSMELQRHCPKVWNECSSRLLRCLSGVSDVSTETQLVDFRV